MNSAAVFHPGWFPVSTGTLTARYAEGGNPALVLVRHRTENLEALALNASHLRLSELRGFDADWDGFGSEKPSVAAIERTAALLPTLYRQAATSGYNWQSPHISASEAGEVSLEWWAGTHKLTIYVGPQDMSFVRVWGVDINEDMSDGEFDAAEFTVLWQWLHS